MAGVQSYPPEKKGELRKILLLVDRENPVVALQLEFQALTGLRYVDAAKLTQKQIMINGVIRDTITIVQQKPYNKRVSVAIAKAEKNNITLSEAELKRIKAGARKLSEVKLHFNDQAKAVIEDAMQQNPGKVMLFESSKRPGQPYTAQYFNKLLKLVACELKLTYPLSTHSFRKSFALMNIRNGAGTHEVRDMLGQSDLASTDHYLQTFMSSTKALTDKIEF